MPSSSLTLSFYHLTDKFLDVVIENIQDYGQIDMHASAEAVCWAAGRFVSPVSRIGYVIDGSLFDGVFEREIDLERMAIHSLLHDAMIFHYREIRFSVQEGHLRHGVPHPYQLVVDRTDTSYVPRMVRVEKSSEEPNTDYEEETMPKTEEDFDKFLSTVEARQKSLLERTEQPYLSNEVDSVISFTDFLKKLETRQMAIMNMFPFNSSSSTSSSRAATVGTPENSPIEIGHDALSDDVFQPQLPHPDQEIFFDTAESLDQSTAAESLRVDLYLNKMMEDVLEKLEIMEEKNRTLKEMEDALLEKDVRSAFDFYSQQECRESMASVENFPMKHEKARLSMTVATSTGVEGKREHVQVETQTDKDSDSGEDVAAIRECLRTILKNKKMNSFGKKSSRKDGVEESKVSKKSSTRSSKSPKCCCCRKEDTKEEKKKKETKEVKEGQKEEKKKETPKEEKKEKTLKTIMKEAERTEKKKREGHVTKKEKTTTKEWNLGEPFPSHWFKKNKDSFDLMSELEKVLPTSSEIEEPFNRKLREKWAHDGMKSLKMPTPIKNIRFPERHRTVSRFDRFQKYSSEDIDDQVMDMYNLVRIDGYNYKIVPRLMGAQSGLHRAPKGESSAPIGVHLAVVDESDPFLNWENQYFKVFRVSNVGNKTVKAPKLMVIHSENATIARDLSKIPEQIPVDYNVDFELLFALTESDKDGVVILQLKNEEGGSLSAPFAFMIPKIVKPYLSLSEVLKKEENEHIFYTPTVDKVSATDVEETQTEHEEEEEEFEKIETTEDSVCSDFELVSAEAEELQE